MGSLDILLYCCGNCKGLFDSADKFTPHTMQCHGNPEEADCEFVACAKNLYLQFIFPIQAASSTVMEAESKSSDTKPGHKRVQSRIMESKSNQNQNQKPLAPGEGTSNSPRRYSLREGAAKALHQRIHSMQMLLAGRSPAHTSRDVTEKQCSTENDKPLPGSQKASKRHEPELGCPREPPDDSTTSAEDTQPCGPLKRKRGRPRKATSLSQRDTAKTQLLLEKNHIEEHDGLKPKNSSSDTILVHVDGKPHKDKTEMAEMSKVASDKEEEDRSPVTRITDVEENQLQEGVVVQTEVDMEADPEEPIGEGPDAGGNCQSPAKKKNENTDPVEDSSEADDFKPVLRSKRRQALRTLSKTSPLKKKIKKMDTLPLGPPDSTGVYHCSLCSYKSRKKGMFRRHMSAHNDGDKYVCEECGAEFIYRRLYNQHLGRHKGFSCGECGKVFTRAHDRDRHAHVHKGLGPTKVFACSICEYTCHYPNLLSEHVRKHTGERYQCLEEDCTFETIYKRALNHHKNTVHNNRKHLICDMCGYRANDSSMFGRHVRTHKGKSYKCPDCDYTATSMAYVKTHALTHTREKIFQCDQCKFRTARPTGLRLHLMKHIGVKPWQCPICAYSSTTKQKVQRHIEMRHSEKRQPRRRNVCIKFDLSAFRINKSGDSVSCKPKYLVVETVDDPTDTALASNMVGQEVIVNETVETVDSPSDHQPSDQEDNCLYKCAYCDFTQPSIETVQGHMAVEHTDQVAGEIMESSCGEDLGGEVLTDPEQVTILLTTDIITENAEVTIATEEVDTFTSHVEEQTEVEVESRTVNTEVVQATALQDDAVSTAVESILHLQHLSVKEGAC